MKPIELETAKKLKELGLKNKSFSFWRLRNGGEEKGYKITHDTINADYLKNNKDILYMAYTLDEILEMLPQFIKFYEFNLSMRGNNFEDGYRCAYESSPDNLIKCENPLIQFINENCAEAVAQLLIWCIKTGYVKIEDINNALV